MEQRTEQWHVDRKGKFTASEIYKLCAPKGLGQTGESYIMEKAADTLCSVPVIGLTTHAMDHGINYEPIAKGLFAQSTGKKIIETGFLPYHKFEKESGCSPDGLIENETCGIEIKCPETRKNHTNHLLINDGLDLKSYSPQYYWQVQMCCAVLNYDRWLFVSYHPDFNPELQLSAVYIYAEQKDIDFMDCRITEAVQLKNKIINKLISK